MKVFCYYTGISTELNFGGYLMFESTFKALKPDSFAQREGLERGKRTSNLDGTLPFQAENHC